MDDVNLSRHLLDAPGDDAVVHRHRACRAHQTIRQAELSPRQRRRNPHALRNRAAKRRRNYEQIGSSGREPVHLLPRRVANPICSQPQWKAVEHPHALITFPHETLTSLGTRGESEISTLASAGSLASKAATETTVHKVNNPTSIMAG